MMFTIEEIITKITDKVRQNAANVKDLAMPDFIALVVQCQQEIVDECKLRSVELRCLDSDILKTFVSQVQTSVGGRIMLRHGEQDPGAEVNSLPKKGKKIKMMQAEHNVGDTLTPESVLELMLLLFAMLKLHLETEYKIKVSTSANMRAKQPAMALASILGIECLVNDELTCVNYPEDDALPAGILDAEGNLPWEQEKVDAVVGVGIFSKIEAAMSARATSLIPDGTIECEFTHTQQLDAYRQKLNACGKEEDLKLPAMRLGHLGFIFRGNDGVVSQCANGFYDKRTLTLRCAPRAPSVVTDLIAVGVFSPARDGEDPVTDLSPLSETLCRTPKPPSVLGDVVAVSVSPARDGGMTDSATDMAPRSP